MIESPDCSWPGWYTPSKLRLAANTRVARGLHPMGLALGEPSTKCGTCAHCYRRDRGRSYPKCDLTKITRGPSTDIVLSWQGCSRWELRP